MKQLPVDFDEFFILGVLLVFLRINYNGPLASTYNDIMVYIILGYIVALSFFKWIPLIKSNKVVSTLTGVAAGFIFWQIYAYVADINRIQQVFATTAFGDSILIGKVMFGVLIPIIETIFFFRILTQWMAYLLKVELDITSASGHIISLGISAIFTIFHATAKGVTNNTELMATFIFAYISMMLVLYFKEIWQAIVMHIYVNAKSVELITAMPTYVYYIGIAVIVYYLFKNKNTILPS